MTWNRCCICILCECYSGRYFRTYKENIQGTHRGVYNGTYTYITWRMYRERKGPKYKLMYREHKENIHNQGVYSLDIHYLRSHYVLRLFTGRSLRTYVENFQGYSQDVLSEHTKITFRGPTGESTMGGLWTSPREYFLYLNIIFG